MIEVSISIELSDDSELSLAPSVRYTTLAPSAQRNMLVVDARRNILAPSAQHAESTLESSARDTTSAPVRHTVSNIKILLESEYDDAEARVDEYNERRRLLYAVVSIIVAIIASFLLYLCLS